MSGTTWTLTSAAETVTGTAATDDTFVVRPGTLQPSDVIIGGTDGFDVIRLTSSSESFSGFGFFFNTASDARFAGIERIEVNTGFETTVHVGSQGALGTDGLDGSGPGRVLAVDVTANSPRVEFSAASVLSYAFRFSADAAGVVSNDQFVGGAQADTMHGGLGNDFGSLGNGDDLFLGGAGADTALGGEGRNRLYGEGGERQPGWWRGRRHADRR